MTPLHMKQYTPNVADLNWECISDAELQATTPLGTYFMKEDYDDFTGLYMIFVTHRNARWIGQVDSYHEELISKVNLDYEKLDDIKEIAFKHHEKLVHSMLIPQEYSKHE